MFDVYVSYTLQRNHASAILKCLPADSEQPANTPSGSSNGGSRTPTCVKKRLVAASRMNRLPKEHFRVIVRARRGRNVKNVSQVKIGQALVTAAGLSFTNAVKGIICSNATQNILMVSATSEHNTKTYAGVEAISIGSANYEASSYLAAPDNTCKGILRNIYLEFDHKLFRSLIAQPKNTKALETRRIKNSTTVVILFDGLKVPNYVMRGISMLGCTLYRRRTEGLRSKFPKRPTGSFTKVRARPLQGPHPTADESWQLVKPVVPRSSLPATSMPRTGRGVTRATRKGDDLWQAAANHDLTLVTDPTFPTRIGTSCSRDTTPDLIFAKNVGAVSWHNLNENLGSDHNIFATCISVKSKPLKEFTIMDWD
ncbi:hypothetical protein HPB47_016078 [Ixodes persulcatus]|uniref:Uncharacterized protein n=1 Tax=Ixodes persulcatus TaxID=34615 RepID=A0AC60QRV4_IXOPE|nr:hypothetical protein HPB47_016078 [Ixodes persulcatus]